MNRSLGVIAALLLACVALAAPAPELFVSGWGKPVDPDKNCKIRRDPGAFTIEMPGTVHVYAPHLKRLNAPRLLRDFEGDFEMQVRVRFDSRVSAQSSVKGQPSYVSAGFLIFPPETFATNCILVEYRVSGQGDQANDCVAQMKWWNEYRHLNSVNDKHWRGWPFKVRPEHVYQRLERQGEVLLYNISSDGKKWVTMGGGHIQGLPAKLKVGLVACTTSTNPSKVIFDQLKIKQGKKKEDKRKER